jgi:hypothetical protein
MKRSREPEDILQPVSGEGDYQEGSGSEQSDLPAAKFTELDPLDIRASSRSAMKCSLPPHKDAISFDSYEDYEVHYNKAHLNRCIDCRKNFPSAHLLNVHIEECHDSFVAVKRDRGEHTVSRLFQSFDSCNPI